MQVCSQVGELIDELFQAEGAFERAQEIVKLRRELAGAPQRAPEQRELAVDLGFLAGDAGGRRVIRARIGDAAADDVAVVVQQNSLGRRGTEIDTDEGFHGNSPQAAALAPARFCSIIWK